MEEQVIKASMDRVIEHLRGEIASIRTGRATSGLVEDIVVSAYGGTQRLRIMELASIIIPDAQTIVLEPWDKSIIGEIKQAILGANIGLTPNIDSDKIKLFLPPLTTESREKYVKLLKTKLEEGRVAVRQVRGDAMHDVKKKFEEKEITEDEKFLFEKKIQDLTDQYVLIIEELGKKKEQELLTV